MKERITIENRIVIEELLRQNFKLKDIASAVSKSLLRFPEKLRKEELTIINLSFVLKLTVFLSFVITVLKNTTVIWENTIIIIELLTIFIYIHYQILDVV